MFSELHPKIPSFENIEKKERKKETENLNCLTTMCEYPRNDATIPPRGLHESGTRSGIVVKEFDRGVGQVCFAVRCRGHRRRQGTATRE